MSRTVIHSFPDLKKAREKRPSRINYDEVKVSPFLSEYAKGKKYYVVTHGCQANMVDGETIKGMLFKCGFVETNNTDEANVIVINTCAVRENAEDKVFGEIGNLKRLHKKKDVTICVCGCMALEEEIVTFIKNTFPHVDLIFGTHDLRKFLPLLEETITTHQRIIDVTSGSGDVDENLPIKRDSNFKASINITYGCDKFCTYCIVPYTRGRERSRLKEDILAEVKCLLDQGYQELTLLGQNVNAYGKDLEPKCSFGELLEEVAKTGFPRIRFLTSHPWDFSTEMIDVISKYPNVMKYIHLPLQSGDDEILKLMGRRYSSEQYLSLVKEIRTRIPNATLSTDIIVGFPNESYEQFSHTLDVVKKANYDSAFTFIYSPRKGTPAAKIEDNVTYEEKVKRFKELTSTLSEIIEKNNQKLIGKTTNVLVEGISKNDEESLTGYTEDNHLVNFKGDASYIGKFVKVKILSSHVYFLLGEIDE